MNTLQSDFFRISTSMPTKAELPNISVLYESNHSAVDNDIAEDYDSAMSQVPVVQSSPKQTYADAANSRFYKSKSQYVSLEDLLVRHTQKPLHKNALTNATNIFLRSYGNVINEWDDLKICKALPLPLDKILVDITLQRMLDINHLTKIVAGFDPNSVMALNVYCDDSMPGYYICFDGMHTASALYTIAAALRLQNELDKCIVPGSLYYSNQKSVIRSNFVYLNSVGKQPLIQIDLFQQMVFGVRTDGSTNPEWLLAEQKQQYLEKAGLFATHTKFGDAHEPGAFHTMTELLSNKYDISITEQFCTYFKEICGSNRPVATKESWLIYNFFRHCQRNKINVTKSYIKEVARALNLSCPSSGQFDANEFCSLAVTAYDNWYRTYYSSNGTLQGIRREEKIIGAVYLNAVLAKYTNLPIPVINTAWFPAPADVK